MKRITDEDRAIGARLRQQRMLAGMSQEELGRALGLTFQQIQKYENGQNRIASSKLAIAAEILGVSVLVFFEDTVGLGRGGITPGEAKLLRLYRQMPEAEQDKVMSIVRAVAEAWGDTAPSAAQEAA